MKNKFRILAIIASILASSNSLPAQWVQINGLYGGIASCFVVSGNNLFAGTNGGGVFLSTNNGTSWTAVNTGLTNLTVYSLALSGTNLFAGTNGGGVFLSTNNGTSWTAVNTGLTDTTVIALATSGTNLFAGTNGGGVFLSNNNGTTWTAVNAGLTNTSIYALASSGTDLFAGTWGSGVFLSTNNGATWSAVGLTNRCVLDFAISGLNLFAGTDNGGVFLSTDNGTSWTTVSLGIEWGVSSLAISGTNLFAGTTGGGVFLSTDNGTSWTAVNTGLTNLTVYSLALSGTNLFAGTNGGGVFLSTNNGTTWTAVNAGLTNTSIYALASSGTNLFAGTRGSGVFLSTNDGTSWIESCLANPYVLALAISAKGIGGTNLFAGTAYGGVFLSTDNGTSWTTVSLGIEWGVSSLAISGTNLFAGTTGGGVFLSTDNGTSWTAVNTGLTNLTVYSLALSGTNLFAGTNGGGVFLSADNGMSWTTVSLGTRLAVRSLAVSGANLFAGTDSGGVFLSTNNGTSWTIVSPGVVDWSVPSLAVSGTNLFAGTTGGGVFLSTDNGTSWTAVNTGLTNLTVYSLAVNGTNLFVGTFGSGVWRRPLSEMRSLPFTDVTVSSGILTSTANVGSSWGDFNGDGYLDLFQSGVYYPDGGAGGSLFKNNGNGTFTLLGSAWPSIYGSVMADFNGDGKLDMLFPGTYGSGVNSLCLYLGDGTGNFSDNTSGSGLASLVTKGGAVDPGGSIAIASVADYDRDGNLKIAFSGYYGGSGQIHVLKNVGGTYSDVTSTVLQGSYSTAESWNPAWVDINNDGYPDLWIPGFRSQTATGQLFINDKRGHLVLDASAFLGYHASSIGSAWGDFDNDGYMDLVVASYGDTTNYVRLFKNNGDCTFTNVTPANFPGNGSIRGICWGDYDNDGHLDLLLGSNTQAYLFHNNGDGTFTDVTSSTVGYHQAFKSAMFVDYNNDGKLDAYFSNARNVIALMRNELSNSNHWLGFRPSMSTGNNRSAIGARFVAYAKIDGVHETEQIRDIQGGGSGCTADGNMWANFGLGSATVVDSVIALWPDGCRSKWAPVPVDKYYSVSPGTDISLAVEATNLKAVASVDYVLLSWQTQSERNNLGFNLYRKDLGSGISSIIASYSSDASLRGLGTSMTGRSYSYKDCQILNNHTYEYTIESVASNGTKKDYPAIQVKVDIPKDYALYQNYPNPFNPSTTITYDLPKVSHVVLVVYDDLGRKVRTLVDDEKQAGSYQVTFDAGTPPSGVYFYRLQAGSFAQVKKLTLMK